MNIKSREQGNTKITDKLVVVYAMRSVTGTKKKGNHYTFTFCLHQTLKRTRKKFVPSRDDMWGCTGFFLSTEIKYI